MAQTVVDGLDAVARRQFGLVTRAQAAEILGRDRAKRWIGDGRLDAVQPRVLRLAGAPRTHHQAMHAASLAADGPISHRSASWVWAVRDRSASVDVSVVYPRRVCLRGPAVAHRIRDLTAASSLRRHGMLLTNPMRTILDLGLVEPWWAVDEALGRAIGSKLLSVKAVIDLREHLARRGRNGTGVTQRVLDERLLRGADDDSVLELRLLHLIQRFGLPPVAFQYEVWHEGRFIGRLDAAYPARMIGIEADGFAAHSSPEAFETDRERQNALVALGWQLLRFTRTAIIRRPREVADRILSVL